MQKFRRLRKLVVFVEWFEVLRVEMPYVNIWMRVGLSTSVSSAVAAIAATTARIAACVGHRRLRRL